MMDESTFDKYVPSPSQMQQVEALIRLLKQCDQQEIAICVFGGYGLDALYGKLTRDHGDFDLVVETEAEESLVAVLTGQGYEQVPEWREPGRKEVFVHSTLAAPFKVEVGTIDAAKLAYISQQFGFAVDRRLFFPETPNGELLGYPMRVPTLEGIEVINRIQAQTGAERGWAEFSHRRHQEALMTLLKREQSL